MSYAHLKQTVALSICMVTLAGCVAGPTIGNAPGATPPRMVIDQSDKKSRIWDNPNAFGPVPESEKARGARACITLDQGDDHFVALGYHPKAQNIDGNTFQGGGFYCARK